MLRRSVLGVALVVTLSGCAWAQYRGDAAHSGFQPFESTIGVSNVSGLAESWSSSNVDATGVVAGGVLYAPSIDGLKALDAAGVKGCSGSPRTCSPLWTGVVPSGTVFTGTPAVANGVVYVNVSEATLLAFDAAGVNGCGGVPKTCAPMWSATVEHDQFFLAPTVANGVVYVADNGGGLFAFDAAGVGGCSGVPKTCAPLWTASDPNGSAGTPSVANGIVYLGGNYQIEAFDAAGVKGCTGVPKTCAALWTAPGPDRAWTLAVADGVVYASGRGTTTLGELDAYDAAGVTGCAGVPKTCTPLWTANTPYIGNPTVALQTVFAAGLDGKLYAFDAKGGAGCSGTPKVCTPKWTSDMHLTGGWQPTVANGVVYAPTFNKLFAFDATGTGCSGSPAVCQPLWVSPQYNAGLVDPIVVNGTVFVYCQDRTVHALRLPAT